ncbi:MAG: filamentous hemagglutinin N-terminal domain-containing protein, partial [Desulfovibrio sp.]|nr:filamentous hemagglutinin N-terminal domain-containing protein [Desulfovibrio sp.]
MKTKTSFLSKVLSTAMATAMLVWPCGVTAGNLPTGAHVVSGSVTIDTNGKTMNIAQGSDKAIINWDSFSIGKGYAVDINQISSQAAMLARVTGASLSEIYGSLTANGTFYLVNPNGIVFGSGAVLDINKFIASTLDISNADFLAGRDAFSGDSLAKIVNEGTINAQAAALIARNVENAGAINAANQAALLGADGAIKLENFGNGASLSIDFSGLKDNRAATSVVNTGSVAVDDGVAILSAEQGRGYVGVTEGKVAVATVEFSGRNSNPEQVGDLTTANLIIDPDGEINIVKDDSDLAGEKISAWTTTAAKPQPGDGPADDYGDLGDSITIVIDDGYTGITGEFYLKSGNIYYGYEVVSETPGPGVNEITVQANFKEKVWVDDAVTNRLNSGNLTITHTGTAGNGDLNVKSGVEIGGSAKLSLKTTEADINSLGAKFNNAGGLEMTSGGNINFSGTNEVTGASKLTAADGKEINLAGDNTFNGNATLVVNNGTINFDGANEFVGTLSGNAKDVNVASTATKFKVGGGTINATGTYNYDAAAAMAEIIGDYKVVTDGKLTQAGAVDATGNVQFTANNDADVEIAAVTAGGNAKYEAVGGEVKVNGEQEIGGNMNVKAGAGYTVNANQTVGGNQVVTADAVTLAAGVDVKAAAIRWDAPTTTLAATNNVTATMGNLAIGKDDGSGKLVVDADDSMLEAKEGNISVQNVDVTTDGKTATIKADKGTATIAGATGEGILKVDARDIDTIENEITAKTVEMTAAQGLNIGENARIKSEGDVTLKATSLNAKDDIRGNAIDITATDIYAEDVIVGNDGIKLDAANNITAKKAIYAVAGDIEATAGNSITVASVAAADSAAGVTLKATAGDVIATDKITGYTKVDITAGGTARVVDVEAAPSADGALTIKATDIYAAKSTAEDKATLYGKTVEFEATNNVTVVNEVTDKGGVVATSDTDTAVSVTAGQDITVDGATAANGGIKLEAGKNLTATKDLTAATKIDIDATNGTATVAKIVGSTTAEVAVNATDIYATDTIGGNTVKLEGTNNVTTTADVAASAADAAAVDISAGKDLNVASVTATDAEGGIKLEAGKNLTATGALTAYKKIEVSAENGTATLDKVDGSTGSAEVVVSAGDIKAKGAVNGKTVEMTAKTGDLVASEKVAAVSSLTLGADQ